MPETAPKPLVKRGTGNKRSDAKPWVPGLLNLIDSLRIRADVWDDLEDYLMCPRDVTYEGLNEYSHALQVKVFSHVDKALTPSADKTYTGSLDSFVRVILMAGELLSSNDFESCKFSMEKILPCCDRFGPGARDAFEALDTLQTLDLAPHIRELLAAPHIATLASLECITRQRESHHALHGILSVYTGERRPLPLSFWDRPQCVIFTLTDS